MLFRSPICLSIFVSVYKSHLPIYLSAHLSINMCLHIYVSISLSVWISACKGQSTLLINNALNVFYSSFMFILLLFKLFKARAKSSSTEQRHPSAQRIFVKWLSGGAPKKSNFEKNGLKSIRESPYYCSGGFI